LQVPAVPAKSADAAGLPENLDWRAIVLTTDEVRANIKIEAGPSPRGRPAARSRRRFRVADQTGFMDFLARQPDVGRGRFPVVLIGNEAPRRNVSPDDATSLRFCATSYSRRSGAGRRGYFTQAGNRAMP
jgi:hypothetical protein